MTTVFEIPDRKLEVNGAAAVEEAVKRAAQEFPSAAWQAVVREIERGAEEAYGGRLRRKGRERRRLWTTAGEVSITRQRYTLDVEERSFVLFDRRLKLERRRRATRACREYVGRMVAWGGSYAKGCRQIGWGWGEGPAVSTSWRWAQEVGKEREAEARARRKAFFQQGLLPGADVAAPEFVGLEADSTMIHAWRQKGRSHEVYVGLAYDGKRTIGPRGKRRVLRNKEVVTGVGGAAAFGEEFFVRVQERYNVCEVGAVLFSSDGAGVLEGIREAHFPQASHQLDRAHVVRATWEAYGSEFRGRAGQALALLLSEKRARLEQRVEEDARRYPERAEALQAWRQYVCGRWEWNFAARRLRRAHPEVELPDHLEGTGACERTVGTVVGHRMKGRGMGWTPRGAAHMLRLLGLVLLQDS